MEASTSREQFNGSTTLPFLPSEVIKEILLRLPVETLLKFRCVSKSWLSLISSSHFIKNHLNLSKKSKYYANHSVILGFRNDPYSDPYSAFTCSLSSILDKNSHVDPKPKPLHFSNPGPSYPLWIYGNCNGLLLRASGALDSCLRVLFNPTTRKSKILPESGPNALSTTYGLCYNELDDDYRVVEITTTQDSKNGYVNQVKIYSLRSDSWRKIDDDFHCSVYMRNKTSRDNAFVSGLPGIPVGGVLHWAIRIDHTSPGEIFAVDTVTYTYSTLPFPKYVNKRQAMRWGVVEFGGCLGVYIDLDKAGLEIWSMKESWTKVLTVPYYVDPRSYHRPLVGLRDGETLIHCQMGYSMVYNSRDDSFIYHEIPNLHVPFLNPSPIYIASLIAPSFDEE